ncbi:ABC transporter ATP-binding protein [Martelella mediterranea]|uniref:Carbohydrate ABC transporter ATP-binding protein (CUT1 family) n=1 Tax=Martelella mediterranea TaxID=293089 RepID=A0A4R3NQ01_9HYPH|nr:sn-glycerol-3-phosphate ABC transporter ATP-binding protein UgpC [Martelella mediterranea]TCT33065.1 carbohydrate ABC transporter ATP-binding protein (CUT1 family) [Martelella mediterranea]
MSTISLRKLQKSYGAAHVLRDIDLEVEDGAFVVFVGPSGCGKSTLLRMISGLDTPSGGEIFIDGNLVNDVDPKGRGIAMVFQSYALYPHMTVAENMGFGLKIEGRPKEEIQATVGKVAQTLQLEPLLKRMPRDLSGGQRQRVAIGRAIVRDPNVFLFDEPLSNLDAELRIEMRQEIARLHKQLDATMIYVTHDQVEAMTLADKIVVLRAGRVEQVGNPIELYENPANEFVAGFIGSPKMNMFDVTVTDFVDGNTTVAFADGTQIAIPTASSPSSGDRLRCGIRPEHISPQKGGTPFAVEVVERLGHGTYLYGGFLGGEKICLSLPQDYAAAADETIGVAFDRDKARLFDQDGKRVY